MYRRSPDQPVPRRRAAPRFAVRTLAVLALLGLWQVVAMALDNPSFIPAPKAVWDRLLLLSTTHDGIRGYSGSLLIEHLGVSLRRILIGSAIGVVGGLVLGASSAGALAS